MGQKQALLRPVDVGPLLGMRRTRVYALLRMGVIPAVRIGGALRIPRAALEEWLSEQARIAMEATRTSARKDADR